MQSFVSWRPGNGQWTLTEPCRVSAGFPRSERFGLTNQIRRAATSIPPKIAEGAGASSNAQFRQFASLPCVRPTK
ncbi:MAG: four helix bundle protein [Chloroflexi bacterium]|nr:four helix bundle protein [Chloroflexota bacterium]